MLQIYFLIFNPIGEILSFCTILFSDNHACCCNGGVIQRSVNSTSTPPEIFIYTDWDMFYIFSCHFTHCMHVCKFYCFVIFDHSLHHTDRIMWSWSKLYFEFYSYHDRMYSLLLFKMILEWVLNQFFFTFLLFIKFIWQERNVFPITCDS